MIDLEKKFERDFHWQRVRHFVKDRMGKEQLPDLNTILLLIGIQESGIIKKEYSKEEKQDLMHVAVCELLEKKGYFEFVGRDEDGWPHYRHLKPLEVTGADEQEEYLKESVIHYFDTLIEE
jgi:hypothetical protein